MLFIMHTCVHQYMYNFLLNFLLHTFGSRLESHSFFPCFPHGSCAILHGLLSDENNLKFKSLVLC